MQSTPLHFSNQISGPNRSPVQRVRFGKEGQGSGADGGESAARAGADFATTMRGCLFLHAQVKTRKEGHPRGLFTRRPLGKPLRPLLACPASQLARVQATLALPEPLCFENSPQYGCRGDLRSPAERPQVVPYTLHRWRIPAGDHRSPLHFFTDGFSQRASAARPYIPLPNIYNPNVSPAPAGSVW